MQRDFRNFGRHYDGEIISEKDDKNDNREIRITEASFSRSVFVLFLVHTQIR